MEIELTILGFASRAVLADASVYQKGKSESLHVPSQILRTISSSTKHRHYTIAVKRS